MGQAITAHAYPPPVWSPGEVMDRVQISAANLHAGSYSVWMGMYLPLTQARVTVEAETGVVEVLAGCGESCGLPMLLYGNCAISGV